MLPASSDARVVQTLTADSPSYASADLTTTARIRPRERRLKIRLTATETYVTYSYDDDYNRIEGPQQTRDLSNANARMSGRLRVECVRKGQPWYMARSRTTTFAGGTRTIQLPMVRPHRCRFASDVTAYTRTTPSGEDSLGISLRLVIDAVR
jgi:hypothetical protein